DRARASAKHMRALDAVHPLVLLANLKLPSRKPAGTDLSLERLTEWLAGVSGHRYLRIDPTRVDVATTTALVSHAYAQRHRILPVEVSLSHATLATSEPT